MRRRNKLSCEQLMLAWGQNLKYVWYKDHQASWILGFVCGVLWSMYCATLNQRKLMYTRVSGTGKSLVIVNLIIQILYAQKQYRKHGRRRNVPRILVCAPSNAAIDEVVIRLLRIRQSIPSRYDLLYTFKCTAEIMTAADRCGCTESNRKCSVGC